MRVVVVGTGFMGAVHIRAWQRIPGVELAAFCDPDSTLMEEKAAKLTGPRPALHQDLRRILDDRSIDVVTIAACNHWHALAAIWAMQAGKHVYVEKPVCHDMFSGAQMMAAARKYGRIAQGGTQRRSSGSVRRGIKALHEGVIGDVYLARCVHFQKRDSLGVKEIEKPPITLDWNMWLGPAREQGFHRNLQPYNWHWFWDFGNGELGNNGVHFIDIARWGLKRQLPTRIASTGGRFGSRDQGQTPNTQLTTYKFDDGVELVVEIRGLPSNQEAGISSGVIFYGSKGHMVIDVSDKVTIYPTGQTTPEPVAPSTVEAEEPSSGRNATLAHFRNYFDALRANRRESLAAEIEEGYLSTAFCLLGNISYRLNREVRFDPRTQRFNGDTEADALLRDRCRKEFSVPDRV